MRIDRSRHRLGFAVLSIVLGSFSAPGLAGCKGKHVAEPHISIGVQITPQPVKAGPVVVLVTLIDSEQRPVSRANIEVEADMSHPGMTPVFGNAAETSPGQYQAVIRLDMGGDWIILLHGKTADGRAFESRRDVKSVLGD